MDNSQQSQSQEQKGKETLTNRPEQGAKQEELTSTSISELISSLS